MVDLRRRILGRPLLLILVGCALFGMSVFLPVMRWRASTVHPSAGSARVFGGEGYDLVDGGFAGGELVPVAVASVAVVALAAIAAPLGSWTRSWRTLAVVVACFYPLWVLFVFLKKLEDHVFPAEGAALLVVAFASIITGWWADRPCRAPTPLRG